MRLEYIAFALICTLLLHSISKLSHRKLLLGEAIETKTTEIILSVLLILIVVLFSAFRRIGVGIGGTDAMGYQLQFEGSTGTLWEQLIEFTGWEPLHAISLWIVRKFTSNYNVFLVLTYIILSFSLIKYAKMFELDKHYVLSTFALMLLFIDSYNIQRNTFAVFMSFYIIDAILHEKYKRATIITIVLTGFHFSAALYVLIVFAFWYIRYFQGNPRTKLLVYLVLSSGVAVFASILAPVILGKTRLSNYSSGSNVSYAMIMAFLLIVIFQKLFQEDICKNRNLDILTILYIGFMPMFVFQLFYAIMYRMMLYSLPVLYILMAEYKRMLGKSKAKLAIPFIILFDIVLIVRMMGFFTKEMVDIGDYMNILVHF